MNPTLPPYSVAIRTLGLAGEKFRRLLSSLHAQTHRPDKIIIYLAQGYSIPPEATDREQIVFVPKGMVAQRALSYDEIDTEWILFLDDDIEFRPDAVETMFNLLAKYRGDVICPDILPHTQVSRSTKIKMALLMSAIPRLSGKNKGYRVNILGSYCYNPNPVIDAGWSTTNAGAVFLCRKRDFLSIHFEEDLWLDQSPYAIPEDMVMFYKMHLHGLKQLTWFHPGAEHLDAGSAMSNDRARKIAFSHARNRYIFYRLYVYPHLSSFEKAASFAGRFVATCISWVYVRVKSCITRSSVEVEASRLGLQAGKEYIQSINKR